MIISQLTEYLSLHPYFNSLNDNQKFIAISRAYNQIIEDNKEKIEIITFSPSETTIPTLYVYKQPALSLGLTKLIDSYMSEDLFLKDLTEEQRFIVYNIAQSKVERNHNILDHQHYKINTFKEDIILRTPLIYLPALKLRSKILEATIRIISSVIPISVSAYILELTRKTITLIPSLSVATKIKAGIIETLTFIPSLSVTAITFIAEALERIKTYTPSLTVSTSIVTDLYEKIITLTPSLSVSAEVFTDADYTEEITFIPSLTVSAIITK